MAIDNEVLFHLFLLERVWSPVSFVPCHSECISVGRGFPPSPCSSLRADLGSQASRGLLHAASGPHRPDRPPCQSLSKRAEVYVVDKDFSTAPAPDAPPSSSLPPPEPRPTSEGKK